MNNFTLTFRIIIYLFCTKIQLTLQISETVIFEIWMGTTISSVLTGREIKRPPESDALSERKIRAPTGNQTRSVRIGTDFVQTQLFLFNLNITAN
jgi:hypothetical protein